MKRVSRLIELLESFGFDEGELEQRLPMSVLQADIFSGSARQHITLSRISPPTRRHLVLPSDDHH